MKDRCLSDVYIILKIPEFVRAALAVKDYSAIISFFLENPLRILAELDTKKLIKNRKKPTAKDFLQAALKNEIGTETKKRIQKVLDVYSSVEEQQKSISSSTRKNIKKMENQLRKTRNLDETRKVLKKLEKDQNIRSDESLKSGLGLLRDITKGGSHQPDRKNPFFKVLNNIAVGGIVGAVYGYAGGTVASEAKGTKQYSNVGAQAGGIGGACIGSVQAIGEILWDWIYS